MIRKKGKRGRKGTRWMGMEWGEKGRYKRDGNEREERKVHEIWE